MNSKDAKRNKTVQFVIPSANRATIVIRAQDIGLIAPTALAQPTERRSPIQKIRKKIDMSLKTKLKKVI
jgi:hypothetical protein